MKPWPPDVDDSTGPTSDSSAVGTDDGESPSAPTRDRLLTEGLRLFAERGFRATTVGDIESAAGLQPRRGALYRHFPSKKVLLEVAVTRHIDTVSAARERYRDIPSSTVHEEALELGFMVLRVVNAERTFTQIIERDGDRIPELRAAFRERVSDDAYQNMAAILRGWAEPEGVREGVDLEALGVLTLGAMINVGRATTTFAAQPLGLPDERFVHAWAKTCTALVDGIRRRPGQ